MRARTIYEKQVVFWGTQYAQQARSEREKVLKTALDSVANPKKYTKSTSSGPAKYVRNIVFDEKQARFWKGGTAELGHTEDY
ncbi:MAG: hypothetical protein ACOX5D_04675 [Limnochordia bacterium]